MTEAHYTGDLVGQIGGADGPASGDQACQQSATNAGLGGTWIAWMSDASTVAMDHIVDVGPWHRLDGEKVFDNKAQMSGPPLVAINMTELGASPTIGGAGVWTGTRSDRTSGLHCSDWTSDGAGDLGSAGNYTLSDGKWNDVGWPALAGNSCAASNHLYCIEQ